MTDQSTWTPDWAVVPGEVLVEALEERGMTQAELGRRMARPLKTISEIATGKSAITPETAIQLERVLGISATIWLGLEARYREANARARDRDGLEEHIAWLRRFPIKALEKRGVLDGKARETEKAAALLSYFGVSSPTGWDQHWGPAAASFRSSESAATSPYAVAAWLREAEVASEGTELPRLDRTRLRATTPRLRELSRAQVFIWARDQARVLLADAGVGLLMVDGLPGAPVSGAVRWIGENPWIILTLRYRTDDQFWFTLFHEIGHILERVRRREVVEDDPSRLDPRPEEQQANEFARDALIAPAELDEWLSSAEVSREAIVHLAEDLHIAPGIVVGRLQRDGVVGWSSFNRLKRSVGTS